jgi:hypothetical protein
MGVNRAMFEDAPVVTKLVGEAEIGEPLPIPVTAGTFFLETGAAAGYVAHIPVPIKTSLGLKLVTGAVSPKLTAPAVVGTIATVALATALVGQIASITALVIAVAVTEETPWSLTGLPLKTMQKVVRILSNRE